MIFWAKDIDSHEAEIALELMRRSVKIVKAAKKKSKRKHVPPKTEDND